MSHGPGDARLREFQFLAKLEREAVLTLTFGANDPDRLMVLHLLLEGYVNDLAALSGVSKRPSGLPVDVPARLRDRLEKDLDLVLTAQQLELRINHKGRVRLSELEQALQAGRDRDPTGLMLSKRHLDRDLAIAVISARPEMPVSVAFLDMNGLKAVNDRYGHAAGDEAIRTYLQVLSMICGNGVEGYRGDGGDEVVLILRAMSKDWA